jgi:phosphinothricin acetyltransferase
MSHAEPAGLPGPAGEVRFEAFTEDRLERACEIYNHYVLNSTATFQITPADCAEMRGIIMQPGPRRAAWAILDGGRMIGYVVLGQHKAREAYGLSAEIAVYLDPAWRGKGIGRAAMALAEGRARELGVHVLVASITATNEASLALSRACGFRECAHYREIGRKFDTWLDVVCLQKILD